MSNTAANLRRQISRANDLQAVVRTMKAMAAASIGQYENSVTALADYFRTVELGLGACLRDGEVDRSPSIASHCSPSQRTIHALIFGSDQGLVGQFNETVTDQALQTINSLPGKPVVWAVGERVDARLKDSTVVVGGQFNVPNSVQAITPLVGQILLEYESASRPEDELYLFYNGIASASSYAPVSQRLLPLDDAWRRKRAQVFWPTKNLPQIMDRPRTLAALTGEYLFVSIFRACAESLASENTSRLAAMQRADKNIDELLASLMSTFHRIRQSSIDEELFDVVSGFDALRD